MSGALVNLGNLTKPATVLVERISDAVGGILKPWQIRRVAKAQADAAIIKASTGIQISQMQQRALVRLVREEEIKQENIERITAKAIPLLTSEAKPAEIEKDWITHFFDRCRLVSDEDMQSLWANILAGEANKPGSFSKRSVELVATLDKRDAQLFTRLRSYAWGIGNGLTPVIPRPTPDGRKTTMSFVDLSHLDSMGLIRFDATTGFVQAFVDIPEGVRHLSVSYFGKRIVLDLPRATGIRSYNLLAGCAVFTQAGRELASVCLAEPSDGPLMEALSIWLDQGLTMWSRVPLPQPSPDRPAPLQPSPDRPAPPRRRRRPRQPS
jgi:hypothetical protein